MRRATLCSACAAGSRSFAKWRPLCVWGVYVDISPEVVVVVGGRAGAARDGEQGEGMNEDTQNKAEQSWSGRACGERVVGA